MNASTVIDSSQIRERAYARWQQRGCPDGAPEIDWLEAEQELFDEQWDVQASAAPVVAVAEAPTSVSAEPQRKKTTRKLAARTARIASVVAAAEASADAPPASAPRAVRRRVAAASR